MIDSHGSISKSVHGCGPPAGAVTLEPVAPDEKWDHDESGKAGEDEVGRVEQHEADAGGVAEGPLHHQLQRAHRVFADGDGYKVEDLGSTNGTYVNGRRISVPTPAGRGDTVQIGKTILEVR